MKKIDFEAHAQLPAYAHAMGDTMADRIPLIYDFGAQRLAEMDAFGVATQVLSYPGRLNLLSGEEGLSLIRAVNDNSHAAACRHPGRFVGCAVVPVNDNDAAIAELTRCKHELGLPGWFAHSSNGDLTPDDALLPVVRKAAELGMFIYLHPAAPTWSRFAGLGPIVGEAFGFHVDTALTLLRLVCLGVLDEYPDLKIILGHFGEALPFMLDRLDSMSELMPSLAPAVNRHAMRHYFQKNIWVTSSGNYSKAAFECTRAELGIDHILFGTDFPTERLKKCTDFFDSLALTKLEREKIFFRNAEDYFGIRAD